MAAIHWGGALLIAGALLFSAGLRAQETQFVEGAHYELLGETQPVQTGEQIEVVEMFWYECPHCYQLEPYMHQWLETKPENAAFIPMPAVFDERWEFGARIYYTLAAVGLAQELHAAVFKAIHEDNRPLDNEKRFTDWAVENGADRETLSAAFASFAVESNVQFSKVMSRNYNISGVPAVIVDGKYLTSVSLAGGHEKLLEVINYLVGLAAEQRSG